MISASSPRDLECQISYVVVLAVQLVRVEVASAAVLVVVPLVTQLVTVVVKGRVVVKVSASASCVTVVLIITPEG